MPDISWPPRDLNAVSAVEWASAFTEAHPEAAALEFSLANWFLSALRAGYKAGMSHAEFPEA